MIEGIGHATGPRNVLVKGLSFTCDVDIEYGLAFAANVQRIEPGLGNQRGIYEHVAARDQCLECLHVSYGGLVQGMGYQDEVAF